MTVGSYSDRSTDANDRALETHVSPLHAYYLHSQPLRTDLPATGLHSASIMKLRTQPHGVGSALGSVQTSRLTPPHVPRLLYIASLPRIPSFLFPLFLAFMDLLDHYCCILHRGLRTLAAHTSFTLVT